MAEFGGEVGEIIEEIFEAPKGEVREPPPDAKKRQEHSSSGEEEWSQAKHDTQQKLARKVQYKSYVPAENPPRYFSDLPTYVEPSPQISQQEAEMLGIIEEGNYTAPLGVTASNEGMHADDHNMDQATDHFKGSIPSSHTQFTLNPSQLNQLEQTQLLQAKQESMQHKQVIDLASQTQVLPLTKDLTKEGTSVYTTPTVLGKGSRQRIESTTEETTAKKAPSPVPVTTGTGKRTKVTGESVKVRDKDFITVNKPVPVGGTSLASDERAIQSNLKQQAQEKEKYRASVQDVKDDWGLSQPGATAIQYSSGTSTSYETEASGDEFKQPRIKKGGKSQNPSGRPTTQPTIFKQPTFQWQTAPSVTNLPAGTKVSGSHVPAIPPSQKAASQLVESMNTPYGKGAVNVTLPNNRYHPLVIQPDINAANAKIDRDYQILTINNEVGVQNRLTGETLTASDIRRGITQSNLQLDTLQRNHPDPDPNNMAIRDASYRLVLNTHLLEGMERHQAVVNQHTPAGTITPQNIRKVKIVPSTKPTSHQLPSNTDTYPGPTPPDQQRAQNINISNVSALTPGEQDELMRQERENRILAGSRSPQFSDESDREAARLRDERERYLRNKQPSPGGLAIWTGGGQPTTGGFASGGRIPPRPASSMSEASAAGGPAGMTMADLQPGFSVFDQYIAEHGHPTGGVMETNRPGSALFPSQVMPSGPEDFRASTPVGMSVTGGPGIISDKEALDKLLKYSAAHNKRVGEDVNRAMKAKDLLHKQELAIKDQTHKQIMAEKNLAWQKEKQGMIDIQKDKDRDQNAVNLAHEWRGKVDIERVKNVSLLEKNKQLQQGENYRKMLALGGIGIGTLGTVGVALLNRKSNKDKTLNNSLYNYITKQF